jgi:hypothetical protein
MRIIVKYPINGIPGMLELTTNLCQTLRGGYRPTPFNVGLDEPLVIALTGLRGIAAGETAWACDFTGYIAEGNHNGDVVSGAFDTLTGMGEITVSRS